MNFIPEIKEDVALRLPWHQIKHIAVLAALSNTTFDVMLERILRDYIKQTEPLQGS